MDTRTRRPVNKAWVVMGLVFLGVGLYTAEEGLEHVRSGLPIPATTRTKATTGGVQLLYGALISAVGAGVLGMGLRGRGLR